MRPLFAIVSIFLFIQLLGVPLSSVAAQRQDGWATGLTVFNPSVSINYRHFSSATKLWQTVLAVGRFTDDNVPNPYYPGDIYDVSQSFVSLSEGMRHYGGGVMESFYSEWFIGVGYSRYDTYRRQENTDIVDSSYKSRRVFARATIGAEYPITQSWFFEANAGFYLQREWVKLGTESLLNNMALGSSDDSRWYVASGSFVNIVYYF